MRGANDRTLQTLMGHKSQRMIIRYAHLGPTHLMNALPGEGFPFENLNGH